MLTGSIPQASMMTSGEYGVSNSIHSLGRPASFLALSITLLTANSIPIERQMAGSPVARKKAM